MARKSDNAIPSMNVDWSYDPTNGLPYSGTSVQAFLKQVLNSKAGAGYFDSENMILYLFKDDLDRAAFEDDPTLTGLIVASVPMRFGTTQYRIYVTTSGSTTINATVNQETIPLEMGLQAQTRELGESTWNATGQDIGVRVYVDVGATGEYEEIPGLAQVVVSSVGELSVDIKPYIQTGLNRVRFYFYATDDPSLTSTLVWNITLAEMYIEPWGNTWYNALVENGNSNNYHFGGFRIVGTLSKTIHIEVATASSVVASYSRDIGGTEAIESPYYFTRNEGLDLTLPHAADGTSLSALSTGVYNVKVWLTSGNLTTEDNAIMYSIIYVAPGDEYTAELVVMNNYGNEVNNYDESAHLCDYAIYNKGETYGTPVITITPYIAGSAGDTVTLESEVFAETEQHLNHSINLITNYTNIYITYRITMPDNYQERSSIVNNSEIFPSEDGATFYLNTSLRSNGESTKEQLYNTAGGQSVAVSNIQWEKMSWVDGLDGWTEDENGRKCLMLPARTRLIIPPSGFMFLTGENVTFELCYRVSNVSDYSENVITIAQDPEDEGFKGIRIKPTNVTVHSNSDASSANDIYQGTNIADEEIVHMIITIQNSFGTHSGYNIVTGYLNGSKKFQFSYPSGTIWANTYASAIFGSDSADLYLYSMRFYGGKALSTSGVENNWLNSLATRAEKVEYKDFINSVLRSGSRQIDYETIKDNGRYNFFVVEMTEGSPNVPSTSYPDGGKANVEMHYGVDSEGNSRSAWDWKIYDVETKGQGTTSMNYWLWNIRWRIDKTDSSKKRLVSYYDTPIISQGHRTFVELEPTSSKTVWFDGEDNHPAVKRITAKINFASSMQSHKMGSTRAYDILHNTIENGALLNEAQVEADSNDLPMPSVAVYQYPAFGFQKNTDSVGNVTYTFIGLFTIGPDKGDKPTFGFDLVESDLISLEGVDHTPQMTRFCVPWDEQTGYFVNAKGDAFIATKSPGGNYVNALEVGNAKTADTEDASAAMPVLVSSFKPAYDVVYNNSTLIFPVSLTDETWGGSGATAADVLANINADIDSFQRTHYIDPVTGNDRLRYSDMEFWIEGEYKLYHFEYESESYVSGYKSSNAYGSPVDLRTDTGVTDTQLSGLSLANQNELFKAARRARFIANAPTYWDMRELVFNYCYLLIFGATDNFAKNQYPMYMGGKWRFRQDDLDTIVDIDNNGGQTKPSDIEFEDTTGGSPYFAGSNSVLWNLVHEALWTNYTSGVDSYPGIRTMGREMLEKMSQLSSGDNVYDGFIKFFEKYFWSNAQEYFPPSAYNIDGNVKYEEAWLTGRSFSANPLRQSLGSHYEAERLWVRRRAAYCMSLFGAGVFGTYDNAYLGRIQFRPIELGTMDVTLAESMYPCLILGNNDIRPTERTMAGETCRFTSLQSDGNTVYTLQAVHYLTSLGDLKDLKLGSDDGGTFNVSGKKLTEFKLGDEDPDEVHTTVSTLNIDSTYGLPCLEVIDLRNADSLTGALDLTNCKRLKEVYTEGTHVASIILPRGSKVEKLHMSDYITSISYQVVKYLSELVLPEDPSGITLLYLEECDALNSMDTLESIYNSDGQQLAFIRLVFGTETPVSGPQVRMLANIQNNKDKDGESHNYNGVTPAGIGSVSLNPIIEGYLLADKYYESDIAALAGSNEPEDSSVHAGMKRILANYFGPLYITYADDNAHKYIDFVDPVVKSICATNWGDGVGTTRPQVSPVTSVDNIFANNTQIQYFNEFKYFGVTALELSGFRGCSSLLEIELPSTLTGNINYGFYGCSALRKLKINAIATSASNSSFSYTTSLKRVDVPDITTWLKSFNYDNAGRQPFGASHDGHIYIDDVEVTSAVIPSDPSITSIRPYAFAYCKSITSVTIPSNITSISGSAFNYCSGLTGTLVLRSSITSLGGYSFANCTNLTDVYVLSSSISNGDNVFPGSGNQTGTIYLAGNATVGSTTFNRFVNIIIGGNVKQNGNTIWIQDATTKSIRIGGNYDVTANSYGIGRTACTGLEFIEIGGTVSGVKPTTSDFKPSDGCIIHLGYNGVAFNSSSFSDGGAMGYLVGTSRVTKVYVGSGESQAGDQAVLNLYLADSSWQTYSSKLDLWYNYDDQYKTPPTVPSGSGSGTISGGGGA